MGTPARLCVNASDSVTCIFSSFRYLWTMSDFIRITPLPLLETDDIREALQSAAA